MRKRAKGILMSSIGTVGLVSLLAGCGSQNQTATPGSSSQSKHIVIALSNAYNGNGWRHQMVADFTQAAKEAEAKGEISSYVVDNSSNGLSGQIQQMDTLILQHVSAICIDAASGSALNGVIQKAHQAGIPVISFDTGVTSPYTYNLNTDFYKWGQQLAQHVCTQLNGKGNVVILRTQAGTKSDNELYNGYMSVIKKYPNIKVVASIYGNADTSTVESTLGSLLPSLPKVDAVISAAGSMGAVAAFQNAHLPIPIITNGLGSQSIHWWIQQHQKNGYTTIGMDSRPSMGAMAFYVALDLLNGQKVPQNMTVPTGMITQSQVSQYANLPPNSFADPQVTNQWVKTNLLNQ